MPQALSKCRRPSDLAARHRHKDSSRIWCNRKRFKWQRKMEGATFIPVQKDTASVPEEEDWEQEIEEFSRRLKEEKEKKMSSETPYGRGIQLEFKEVQLEKVSRSKDAEEELKVALCEMTLYSVPHAPRPHQQHYYPSTHHTPPVKWIRRISLFEAGQFADADD